MGLQRGRQEIHMNRSKLPLQLLRRRPEPLLSFLSPYPFRTLTMSGNNPPQAPNSASLSSKHRYIDVSIEFTLSALSYMKAAHRQTHTSTNQVQTPSVDRNQPHRPSLHRCLPWHPTAPIRLRIRNLSRARIRLSETHRHRLRPF